VKRALLSLAAAALAAAGALAVSYATSTNAGSDDRAMAIAAEMRPGEKPGRRSFGLNPSGSQERIWFALQAGSGVGVFCYAYLTLRERRLAS
jgi:ABC-type cobalt transport system substrate-binding protein